MLLTQHKQTQRTDCIKYSTFNMLHWHKDNYCHCQTIFVIDISNKYTFNKKVKVTLRQECQPMLINPCDVFRVQSRSQNSTIPYVRCSFLCEIVTLPLRCAVFLIFDFKNVVTSKSGSEVTQGH